MCEYSVQLFYAYYNHKTNIKLREFAYIILCPVGRTAEIVRALTRHLETTDRRKEI